MMKGRWSEWLTLQTRRLWPWVVVLLCVIITRVKGELNPQDEDLFRYKHPPTDGPHKALWPLDKHDYSTMACATLGLIVAAGGGIGGGGILVPLFILVLKFEPKRAVPLSNVTILGGAIANTLFGLMSRHPIADRPLPDWSLILLMEPTTIVGAVCGSFLNKVLPGIVISILLVVVLGALAHRTLKKGIKQLHREGGCQQLGVECGSAGSSRECSEADSRCSSVARGEFGEEAPVEGVRKADVDVKEGEKVIDGNERQALLGNDAQHVSYASTERSRGLLTPAAPVPLRSSRSHDRPRTHVTNTHTPPDTDSQPPPRSHSVTIPPRHHRGQHRRRSGYVPVEILSTRSPHPTHFNLVNVFSVHSPLLSDNDGVTGEEEEEVEMDGGQTHLGNDGPAAQGQGKLCVSASWAGKLDHAHMVTLPSDIDGRVSMCADWPARAMDEGGTVDARARGAAGGSGQQANGEHAHTRPRPSGCVAVDGRDGCFTSGVAPPRPVVEERLLMSAEGQHGLLGRRPLGMTLRARLIDIDRYVPVWKPVVLTVCFLGIVILDILKGGGGRSPLGFTCGSVAYWVVTLATMPWVLCFFVVIRKAILREYAAKRAANYPFVEGDIVWTPSSTIKFPVLCISAGLFAGIFGVGGGIVKGPLMLEMGVLPPVAAASAATMILYTSAAATVAFYVFGLIPVDYAAFFFVWGFLCTVMGQLLINHLLRRYKSESFIVLSIGVVILLSAVLMAFQALTNFFHHPHDIARFPGLCGSD